MEIERIAYPMKNKQPTNPHTPYNSCLQQTHCAFSCERTSVKRRTVYKLIKLYLYIGPPQVRINLMNSQPIKNDPFPN
jgi:hypothetical protein